MDKGHYVYDILQQKKGTWCNCYDETINQYPGYPINLYDDLLIDKKQKKEKKCVWMDQIGLCSYYISEKTFLH